MSSAIWLALLPWLTRLVGGQRRPERLQLGRELGLAAALGLGVGLLAFLWASLPLMQSHSMGSDFGEYCESLRASLHPESARHSPNRSRLWPWLLGPAAELLGPVDALLIGAIGGVSMMGAGLYLWGRLLHGRLAGLAAALFSLGIPALAIYSRTLSFYPLTTGALVLCTALALVPARRRGALGWLLAGTGLGLMMLVDVRGLLFAGAGLGASLLWTPRRPWLRLPLRLYLLGLPVYASLWMGAWAFPPGEITSLEGQTGVRRFLVEQGYSAPFVQQVPIPRSDFLWGSTPLTELPMTLSYLLELGKLDVKGGPHEQAIETLTRLRAEPWLDVLVWLGPLAALGLSRHPLRLVALAGLLVPWWASLRGALTVQLVDWRFLGAALPPVALLLGLAWATAAEGRAGERGLRRGVLGWAAQGLALGAVLTGLVASPLSPKASWKRAEGGHVDGPSPVEPLVKQLLDGKDLRHSYEGCLKALHSELAAGGPHLLSAELPRPEVHHNDRSLLPLAEPYP